MRSREECPGQWALARRASRLDWPYKNDRMRVTIVVLGDIGRSPRMQYHALALAHASADVDVVGYPGSAIHPTIRDHARITWHFLRRSDPLVARGKDASLRALRGGEARQ